MMRLKLSLLLFIGFILILTSSCVHRKSECNSKGKTTYTERSRLNDFFFYYIKYGHFLRKDSVIEIMCNSYLDGYGYTSMISKRVFFRDGHETHFCLIKDSTMLLSFRKYILDSMNNTPKAISKNEFDAFEKLYKYLPKFAEKYKLNANELKDYLGWYETKN